MDIATGHSNRNGNYTNYQNYNDNHHNSNSINNYYHNSNDSHNNNNHYHNYNRNNYSSFLGRVRFGEDVQLRVRVQGWRVLGDGGLLCGGGPFTKLRV